MMRGLLLCLFLSAFSAPACALRLALPLRSKSTAPASAIDAPDIGIVVPTKAAMAAPATSSSLGDFGAALLGAAAEAATATSTAIFDGIADAPVQAVEPQSDSKKWKWRFWKK